MSGSGRARVRVRAGRRTVGAPVGEQRDRGQAVAEQVDHGPPVVVQRAREDVPATGLRGCGPGYVHSVARGGGLGASGNARGCAREQGGATPAMPEALSRTVRCEGPPALGRPRRSWQLGQPSRHRRTVALPCDGLAAHEDRQGGEQREHQDLGELHQRVRARPEVFTVYSGGRWIARQNRRSSGFQ